jgi:hypothetical protein
MTKETLFCCRVIVNLPRECNCGSKKGFIERQGIEAANSELLMEVSCEKCRKLFLIPDHSSEQLRKICERGGSSAKYRPTWRLNPTTGEIVYVHPYSEKS